MGGDRKSNEGTLPSPPPLSHFCIKMRVPFPLKICRGKRKPPACIYLPSYPSSWTITQHREGDTTVCCYTRITNEGIPSHLKVFLQP